MDLTWTESEAAFRAECRSWLEANVPERPLPSGDTREGFALHVEWEKQLFDARWAVVSWPEAYGGRDASLWEWLIFEEEYYPWAPAAGHPERHLPAGPDPVRVRHPRAAGPLPAPHGRRRGPLVPGLERAQRGSDLAGIQSRAVRDEAAGGWRLTGQEGLDHPGRVLRPTCSGCSAPIPRPSATGHDLLPPCRSTPTG
ncbi:MAG: acyl-CoA dehydrogenase family protein [Acidimicrobiales bacterium]